MQNTKQMPSAPMPMDPPVPPSNPPAKKEHWLVELVGGLTLATTMVSALALWYVFADTLFSNLTV